MSREPVRAVQASEIAPGGMLAVAVEGHEIVICNCDGRYYALARRCGHMNAPLEMGTLEGTILTCPLHCARFDVTTGEALAGPVPTNYGREPLPDAAAQRLAHEALVTAHIATHALVTYPARIEDGWVLVTF